MGLGKDPVLDECPLRAEIRDWRGFLREGVSEEDLHRIRLHSSTGRPLGDKGFLEMAQEVLGEDIVPKKRGPKSKAASEDLSDQ